MDPTEKKGSQRSGSPQRTTPRKVRIEEKRQYMVATNTDGSVVPLMSAREASDYLGISKNTLRRLVKSGVIPAIKLGRLVKFDVLAVRAAIDRNS